MKLRKIFSALLSLCIIAGAVNIPLTALAADNPSYLVKGEVSGGQLVAHVYLRNALAYSGHLALAYDSGILALADKSSLTKAVKPTSVTDVTAEGHDDSVLMGDGYIMFAWHTSATAGVNARSVDKEIAKITFNLAEGASEEDFSRNTLNLYYVNDTMVHGWRCSAEITANVGGVLTGYRNTSVDEAYLCGVEFDYHNCDYIPVKTYNISVRVTDTDGNPLASSVSFGGIKSETGAGGYADYPMPGGTYLYRVSSAGYEVKAGYYIVTDKDDIFNVKLRSYRQIAEDIADGLKITFAEGDYPDSVTAGFSLPAESQYGSISWTSNNAAVSGYGSVTRGEDDIPVTLTATVNVNGEIATRDFDIVVKSRFTAEQKNKAVVSQDKADLKIGYAPGDDAGNVTVGLTLSETGAAGSAISWESSDENIISYAGAVTRPVNDTEVTLTAYIIRGTILDTKEFTVMVKGTGKPAPSAPPEEEAPAAYEEPWEDDGEGIYIDEPEETSEPQVIDESADESNEIVQRVINALEIGYTRDDDAESVTEKLTLPFVGTEGTSITWTSSLPAVVTPYGGVVRQAEDAEVTLTATVKRGEVTAEKSFIVTVKAAESIPANPNNGQEEEIEEQNLRRRRRTTTEQNQSAASGEAGGENQEAAAAPTPVPEKTDTEKITTEVKKFIDIGNVPWAENAINTLAERGVISGTSDTTYSPGNNIRRADFVMLLVKLYGLDAEITDTFEDVTGDKYYYSEVSRARSLGIISGIDDTHFNPESSISRQDMMTMTYRALKRLGKADDTAGAGLSAFKDADSVSDYALDAVKYLVGVEAVHGDTDGNLNPRADTTRAETAVFLFGLTQ